MKMLLIFGAEVNPLNTHCLTPLDLAIASESCSLIPILVSVGGKTSDAILKEGADVVQVQLEPFDPVSERLGVTVHKECMCSYCVHVQVGHKSSV